MAPTTEFAQLAVESEKLFIEDFVSIEHGWLRMGLRERAAGRHVQVGAFVTRSVRSVHCRKTGDPLLLSHV